MSHVVYIVNTGMILKYWTHAWLNFFYIDEKKFQEQTFLTNHEKKDAVIKTVELELVLCEAKLRDADKICQEHKCNWDASALAVCELQQVISQSASTSAYYKITIFGY